MNERQTDYSEALGLNECNFLKASNLCDWAGWQMVEPNILFNFIADLLGGVTHATARMQRSITQVHNKLIAEITTYQDNQLRAIRKQVLYKADRKRELCCN